METAQAVAVARILGFPKTLARKWLEAEDREETERVEYLKRRQRELEKALAERRNRLREQDAGPAIEG